MRRAVFLDRDGVINRAIVWNGNPHPPYGLDELEILPGAPEALALLRAAGFRLIVVTNQPDVARGKQTRKAVETIHAALQAQLPLDDFRVCYHDDADGCACRKPAPGMLLDAAKDTDVDLTASFMVGDRWRDIEAGRRAGCTTVLIDYHYAETERSQPHTRVGSLPEAVDWILNHSTREPGMKAIDDLRVKIFADGADKSGMLEMYAKSYIKGFTTNPTLMRKAGIADYRAFAKEILQAIPDRPISFEVFSDDFIEMQEQALEIASWGSNVYVKVPITNTKGAPCYELARSLSRDGVKLNVTAILTLDQVKSVLDYLYPETPCYVSVFAGRIADTGRDPMPVMSEALEMLRLKPKVELIWASPREVLNIFHADSIGCHIITVSHDILRKISLVGKDLDDYSLDTVKMFYGDAQCAGYNLYGTRREEIRSVSSRARKARTTKYGSGARA
jgi:transaldolase